MRARFVLRSPVEVRRRASSGERGRDPRGGGGRRGRTRRVGVHGEGAGDGAVRGCARLRAAPRHRAERSAARRRSARRSRRTTAPGRAAPRSTPRRWLRCTPACAPIAGRDGPHLPAHRRRRRRDASRWRSPRRTAAAPPTATSAPTATVSRATFTHILCRDPDDGAHVGENGTLPDGLTAVENAPSQRRPRPVRLDDAGVPLSTGWHVVGRPGQPRRLAAVPRHDRGAVRGGDDLPARRRRAATSAGRSRHAADADDLRDPARRAVQLGRGLHRAAARTTRSSATPTGSTSRPAPSNGFNVAAPVRHPGRRSPAPPTAPRPCASSAARSTLRDTATPFLDAPPTGTLTTAAPLPSIATLTSPHTDAGAGLHRVRVRVGTTEVAARRRPRQRRPLPTSTPAGPSSSPTAGRAPSTSRPSSTSTPRPGRGPAACASTSRTPAATRHVRQPAAGLEDVRASQSSA